MARILKGSHGFTCTPRVHPLMERTIRVLHKHDNFKLQPQSATYTTNTRAVTERFDTCTEDAIVLNHPAPSKNFQAIPAPTTNALTNLLNSNNYLDFSDHWYFQTPPENLPSHTIHLQFSK